MEISNASARACHVSATLLASLIALGCSSRETSTAGAPSTKADASTDAGTTEPSAADWTMLGYDLGSTYFNQAETKLSVKTAPHLRKAWEFDGGGMNVTSAPVISRGRAYVLNQGLFALDLATGKQIWTNPDLTGNASLALDGDVLYVHDGPGVLHAVSAEDGKEIWQYLTDDQPGLVGFSSPIVTKDFVLVGGSTLEEAGMPGGPQFRGFVVAVKKDGSLGWKRYTVEEPAHGATLWSTVSVDPTAGLVVAATGNNHGPPATDTADAFLAIPLKDGRDFLWKEQIFPGDIYMLSGPGSTSPDGDFGANAILFDLNGKKLAAGGSKGGDFWVLDRIAGTVLQKRHLGPGSVFKGGVFITGAWDGKRLLTVCNSQTSTGAGSESSDPALVATLFALDPLTLDIQWERQVAGPVYSPITVANGVGFFGKNTTLQAFDTATGEVLAEFATEGTIASAPAVSNGHVVFGSGLSYLQATPGSKYYALEVP
jgi:polyvinyl alcohol dehydrogenase (cytochrome)